MPTLLDISADPLAQFRDGARIAGTDRPMPLIDTVIDVRILGGLAIVRTTRRFANVEDRSIEATITFPVPVHATIVALTASIDARTLVGKAQRRQAARETYEGAIDSGKTAVLHEEALRGIHILSVGHIPPGKEIGVASTWAMPMSRHGTGAMLRIPLTVGDIFGRSPLPDSDDLIHAPAPKSATLTVRCDPGVTAYRDAALVNGSARVRLDRPIDLLLPSWMPRRLPGAAADGRTVTLDIVPASADEAPIQAALLLDQSGSMAEAASAGHPGFGGSPVARTKHQVMVDGVSRTLAALHRHDVVDLWQFNTRCEPVRSLRDLWGPGGGTLVGHALSEVVGQSDAADLAIITDGKSHDIDVQALARSGRRFTAILVGEDSLDAHVGHLAALTGGQLFVVPANGAAHAITAAVESMRRPHIVQSPITGRPVDVAAGIGGMAIRARWDQGIDQPAAGESDDPAIGPDELRAVGAVAAAMAIPYMEEAAAANLAEAHGIVCHLTSLVMIDEAGEAQDGIPAQRKIPLMTPATQGATHGAIHAALRSRVAGGSFVLRRERAAPSAPAPAAVFASPPSMAPRQPRRAAEASPPRQSGTPALLLLLAQIDWSNAEDLRQGELSALPAAARALIAWASELDTVKRLATAIHATPETAAVGLLARLSADVDRNAARLFRAILGRAAADLLAAATQEMEAAAPMPVERRP